MTSPRFIIPDDAENTKGDGTILPGGDTTYPAIPPSEPVTTVTTTTVTTTTSTPTTAIPVPTSAILIDGDGGLGGQFPLPQPLPAPTGSGPIGVPVPIPTASAPPSGSGAYLSDYIQFSVQSIDRDYVLNTMMPITSQELKLKNTSDQLEIQAGLEGIAGVAFTPEAISIPPQQERTVTVTFDPTQINGLGEGVHLFMTSIRLSSTSILTTPLPPIGPSASLPVPTPPIPQPNLWFEERFADSPGDRGKTNIDIIYSRPPFYTTHVQNINYQGSNYIPQRTTVRWTRKINFTAGRYTFTMRCDDGMRVYLDNTRILNSWRNGAARTVNNTVAVSSGEHSLMVEYFNDTGIGVATFTYTPASAIANLTSQIGTFFINNG